MILNYMINICFLKRLSQHSHALGQAACCAMLCMLCNAGSAVIDGLDIKSDMADIYAMMGVCPQHDLLWETLTGREHLLFYGRLKNLKVKGCHGLQPCCSSA